MRKSEPSFLLGLKVIIGLNNRLFVNTSIKNLLITFLQAIILIILVILVFLQDCQITVISGTVILVVLVGAMIVLNTFSYTLNQLS
ncbi:MAG: efflux RND transporter permease subunit [cyanobacterium endosymbiont of Rhopalodia gibba]